MGKALKVYETKKGKQKREIFFTRKNKPDPNEVVFDIDINNHFRNVYASVTAGYIACSVSGTKYVNGKHERCSWLVCYDMNTFKFLSSSAECYCYRTMSISKV